MFLSAREHYRDAALSRYGPSVTTSFAEAGEVLALVRESRSALAGYTLGACRSAMASGSSKDIIREGKADGWEYEFTILERVYDAARSGR
jgi:hypothetical protein